jgi:hypothetical protein
VCQPPLADAMEVAFVSGRSEAQPGVWRSEVNVLAVLQDETDPIGTQLSEAVDGLHLVPTDMVPAEPTNDCELRGQVHPETSYPQRFHHEYAAQDSRRVVSAPTHTSVCITRMSSPAANSTIQSRRGARMRTVASATPYSTLIPAPFRRVLFGVTRRHGHLRPPRPLTRRT